MLDYSKLPEDYRAEMRRYIEYGAKPSSFLFSCLENNLKSAVLYGNFVTFKDLQTICLFIHWELPSACQGTKESVSQWIAHKGLEGRPECVS